MAWLIPFFPPRAAAFDEAASSAHRDALLVMASEQRLHEDPMWRLLGHYRPRWNGGWKSLIDDPAFFNAPRGKFDPKAELLATITAFFEPPSEDPEVRHPVCRFPARFAWLCEKLPVDRSLLPVPVCDVYEKVYQYLKPASLTLVYPAAYMNSPASMFGHTLLVFDSENQNRLLSKGVGYAAAVTTGFGPLFAFQGIFGMYPGRYAIEEYAAKVEQYNQIHRRDIWEYELDLTQEEVDRVFRHTWELQNIWSWYYFFDENCAYKLHQLIDVARPGLKLSEEHPWFVIPIDTVKLVVNRGLVRRHTFRPSKATRLTQFGTQLPAEVRKSALAVAHGRETPDALAGQKEIPAPDRRLALDFSAEYAQYLYTDKQMDRDSYSRRYLEILRERSKLGPREENEVYITWPAPPEVGHSAGLFAPGFGTKNGDVFLSLKGRIAYHGLLDNDTGFKRGAQIMFLNTEARWCPDDDRIELRYADIVHVESIAPRNELFKPTAWRVRFGFSQMDRYEDQAGMIFIAQTGGGAAIEVGTRQLFWAMVESEIHAGDRYREWLAGGPGTSLGWMFTASDRLKWLLQARTAWIYEGQESWWRVEAGAGADFKLSRERSVRAGYQYTLNDDYDLHETIVSLNFYF